MDGWRELIYQAWEIDIQLNDDDDGGGWERYQYTRPGGDGIDPRARSMEIQHIEPTSTFISMLP